MSEARLRHCYFAPSPMLNGLVSFLYIFETWSPAYHDVLRAVLGQLQFCVSGAVRYGCTLGEAPAMPGILLLGPSSHALTVEATGPTMVVGCGLLPAGWAMLVRANAAEFTDRAVDARCVWNAEIDRAHERIGNASCDADRIAALDAFLCGTCVRSPATLDPRIAEIDRWVARAPFAKVDDLSRRLGLSQRQLGRIVTSFHGVPPKLLASKYRTLRASAMLATGQARHWHEAGGDAFVDQAHFINNFRRFVGQPPVAFTTDAARLAQTMMRTKWKAGARSPLSLWS